MPTEIVWERQRGSKAPSLCLDIQLIWSMIFSSLILTCVSVSEPKWQALLLYFTHHELSVCGSPDLSRRSWKMTPTAPHTLDLMSFVHSKWGSWEDVKLYVAFWGGKCPFGSYSTVVVLIRNCWRMFARLNPSVQPHKVSVHSKI